MKHRKPTVTYFYSLVYRPAMASLRDARIYGGIGAILMLVGGIGGLFVPFGSLVIPIVGLILVLIAVNFIANVLNDRAVFNNMLISVILGIVALVVIFLMVLAAVAAFIGIPGPGFEFTEPPTEGDIIAFIAALIVGLAIAWIIYIISAIFMKRSFDAIAAGTGTNLFHTTALLFLIGAILTILIGLGFLLIFVASILMIVAFFTLPEELPGVAAPTPPMT